LVSPEVIPFLDLARQTAAMRTELESAVDRVLGSGQFVLGRQVETFEAEFSGYCGAAECVGVASGTDAITVALRAGGVGVGDEVIVPALTAVPTVSAIIAAGARPVLVDVDPATLTVTADLIAPAITPDTRAIVPVHLYGQPADMGPIMVLARRHGLLVVEDAAQAAGAEYHGRRPGTLGHAAAYSFYPTKNLGAIGDAGAVVTNDADLAEGIRRLRAHGADRAGVVAVSSVHSRIDELQAAILLAKLVHLDRWVQRRRELASLYRSELDDTRLVLPPVLEGARHAFHLFVVRDPDRDRLREQLAAREVGTLVHYPLAIHQHPAYDRLAREADLTVSERAAGQVVSLPLYPELTDAEAKMVVEAVQGMQE
jgi:dTDP-4-amino-4,6-dideoxygalactose transaminase